MKKQKQYNENPTTSIYRILTIVLLIALCVIAVIIVLAMKSDVTFYKLKKAAAETAVVDSVAQNDEELAEVVGRKETEEPVMAEAEEAEEPVVAEAEEAEEPVVAEAEEVEEPVVAEAEEVEEPVLDEAEEVEEPVLAEAEEVEEPVMAEAETEEAEAEAEETTEAIEAEVEELTETAEAETEEPIKAIKKDEAPVEAAEEEGIDKTEEPVRMRAFASSLFMAREGIVAEGAEEQTETAVEKIKELDVADAKGSEEQTAAVAEEIKESETPLTEKPTEEDFTETAPADEVETLEEPTTEKSFISQRVRSTPNTDTAETENAGEADDSEETDGVTGGLDLETWREIFNQEEGFSSLERGDTGEAVEALQTILQELGYPIDEVDGSYGPQTVQVVREFQRRNGLNPNGVFDKETADALFDNPLAYDQE